MAVIFLNNNHKATYAGLSTDVKPTQVENAALFYEIDTGDIYMFDKENTMWYKQESKGGGIPVPPTEGQLGDFLQSDGAGGTVWVSLVNRAEVGG